MSNPPDRERGGRQTDRQTACVDRKEVFDDLMMIFAASLSGLRVRVRPSELNVE